MKVISIILLGFIFCQCSNRQATETANTSSNLEVNDTVRESSQDKELPKKLKGKDAMDILIRTKDFQLDSEGNKTGFTIMIDSFAQNSNEFHYVRTTYRNSDNVNHTISYYRINSKYGYIEKKNLRSKEWARIN